MNKVILMGRLARDPEVRYSTSGKTVAKFSLAVDRKFKQDNGPTADFFNCTTFGKQAEFVEKYLKKGTKVVVSGRIQNDNYTDKNGNQVYSTQIMVEEIEFAESKKAASEQGGTNNNQQSQGGGMVMSNGDFMNIPDSIMEELPFN